MRALCWVRCRLDVRQHPDRRACQRPGGWLDALGRDRQCRAILVLVCALAWIVVFWRRRSLSPSVSGMVIGCFRRSKVLLPGVLSRRFRSIRPNCKLLVIHVAPALTAITDHLSQQFTAGFVEQHEARCVNDQPLMDDHLPFASVCARPSVPSGRGQARRRGQGGRIGPFGAQIVQDSGQHGSCRCPTGQGQ